jgi:hypothetical protein
MKNFGSRVEGMDEIIVERYSLLLLTCDMQ